MSLQTPSSSPYSGMGVGRGANRLSIDGPHPSRTGVPRRRGEWPRKLAQALARGSLAEVPLCL